jgi:orotate phosphoribosyltransferase
MKSTASLNTHHLLYYLIRDFSARVAELLEWQFDTICSLSAAALQLSSFLAWELRKNVVAIDNETYEFQPPEPLGTSYVFVDTVCQTGNHLLQSINKASKHHIKTAGAIFITVNDMMPEEQKRLRFQIVDDMRNDGRLIYVYDISYLYHSLSLENINQQRSL